MKPPQPDDGFEWTEEPWGPALRCAPLTSAASHLFTIGNLRLVEDERDWEAIAEQMGVRPDRVRLIRQVHGIDVAIVRPGGDSEAGRPEADIIVSDDSTVAIGVRVADCAPVLLADRRLGVVGAGHAGWRGTLQNVGGVAVTAMRQSFGSNPADLIAAIGPCLGPCCGEVGQEVLDAFRTAGHRAADLDRWFAPGSGGRYYLDLWAANRDQLRRAGVRAEWIHVAGICTQSHAPLLHSYRVQGPRAGRMAGVIRAGSR